MSLWEYKVITSGKGGFATPALLEKFLNDLGRDEWEIIHFQTPPDNFLAFTGLARRSTQRDWTLEDAAAAAAKAEAEKLRAEFEAKFKAANSPAAPEERASFLDDKLAPDDGFRKPVDTSHDDEPEAAEDEKDDWDKLTAAEEDELPTFFDAIKPHMRRNQRGPGMSVGVDYLAKKWDQNEEDLKGALVECGFVVPADEDSKPEYLEYDGDLYWLNINRRGELWINTKEKPRPVFRSVKAQKVVLEDEPAKNQAGGENRGQKSDERREKAEETPKSGEAEARPAGDEPKAEPSAPRQEGGRPTVPLPEGPALLEKIRPHMRRNRRGPGGSGSTSFLSRALRTNEAELKTAFAALGLTIPANAADKPVYTEFGNELWWLNLDSRGGLWINGRDRKPGETAAAATAESGAESASGQGEAGSAAPASGEPAPAPESSPAPAADPVPAAESAPMTGSAVGETAPPSISAAASGPSDPPADPAPAVSAPAAPAGDSVLTVVRQLLKETRTGSIAAKADRVAEELGKPVDDLIRILVSAGLKVPEKPREKPIFAEHAGEVFWLNRNAKGELWLNAKASKDADRDEDADDAGDDAEGAGDEKPARRGGRSRAKKAE